MNDPETNESDISDAQFDEVWAWCSVMVVAKWQGFEGVDSLGCCSYEDEADFRVGPYFEDMRVQALERLNESVKRFLDRAHRVRAALAAR